MQAQSGAGAGLANIHQQNCWRPFAIEQVCSHAGTSKSSRPTYICSIYPKCSLKSSSMLPHRHNQELEQSSANMHQQNLQLEQEAQALAQRLDAVMQDKFKRINSGFDADTPIDKTLNFLQAFIAVSFLASLHELCLDTPVFGLQE